MTELSDAELVRRCRAGDRGAWRYLVRRISPLVWRIAVRILGRGPEAEDAGQEALMNVHRAFDRFDATRPLEPWVARIAYNTSLKVLQRRRPVGTASERQEADSAPSPEAQVASAEAGALVTRALERLAPQDRVLVTLTYQDGMSNAEVAEAMDMPIGTVKTRLHRARGRLRRWLSPALRKGER